MNPLAKAVAAVNQRRWAIALALAIGAPSLVYGADAGIPMLAVQSTGSGQTYGLTLQLLALMTAITLLPAALLMMTAFTRIVIVLAILRQAIGVGQAPPNQVIIGLSLFLTLFVMSPVIDRIRVEAVTPYMAGTMDTTTALEHGMAPLKGFMLQQTRESDIAAFVRISGGKGFDTRSPRPNSSSASFGRRWRPAIPACSGPSGAPPLLSAPCRQ